ncbi:MAG TPA: hypothetical protein ENN12_04310 [Epsilonproteobacteria bacterium]|nr:hypothetical protein [Campylobacterota bacterium]
MSYKENLQEFKKRVEYKRETFWVYFLGSFAVSLFLVHLFFEESDDSSLIQYFFNIPHGSQLNFYLFFGVAFLFFRWWWKGLPFYILKLPYVQSLAPKWMIRGREKTLEDFFYQGVIISDELPRSKVLQYLSDGKYDISNLFDYNPNTRKKDEDATARIVSYFRDHKREKIVKNTKSRDEEKRKRAQKALANFNSNYTNLGVPTKQQEELYYDLFSAIDGIIDSYKDDFNQVIKADFPSPLKITLDKKTKEITSFYVDESIDVFHKGKVYFSIRMMSETTRNISMLFASFLKKSLYRKSRISTKYGNTITKKELEKIYDFFKIVFFRRLLLNYGAMPSGWFVGRIESYDLRAIFSAVDRELIPTITSTNDGSNEDFSSDVFAAKFLYIYWSFLKSPNIQEVIEGIDWCFNTVKTLTEIQVRNYAQSNAENLQTEEKATEANREVV